MNISVSNIAWPRDADQQVADLFREIGVTAIDIAPGKYFPNLYATTDVDICAVRDWWAKRGVSIIGMQALLFGTTGLNVFGGADSQGQLLNHLAKVFNIASKLGATRLTFGSPKNRDRTGLSNNEALEIAQGFFYRVANIAARFDVMLCLEPNPVEYGCNFLTSTLEAATFVKDVNHSHLRLQLDTGTMVMNSEPPDIIGDICPLIGHIHLSEPYLAPYAGHGRDHSVIAARLLAALRPEYLTIEMLTEPSASAISAVKNAVEAARALYKICAK